LSAGAALGIAAVILFERYEQKDKSAKPDPPLGGKRPSKKKIKLPNNISESLAV